MASRNADWTYWNQLPKAQLWQLVMLSMGLEPRGQILSTLLHDNRTCAPQILERFNIAASHVSHKEGALLYPIALSNSYLDADYNIQKFITWANGMGWQVPPEFTGYSPPKLEVVETPFGKPTGVALQIQKMPEPIKAPEPIKVPDKLTLKWMWDYVPWAFWVSALGGLAAAFLLGVSVGHSDLYAQFMARRENQIATPTISEKTTAPATNNDKIKIDSTIEKSPPDKTGKPAN